MERVSVFIDGANFYYGVKSIKESYSEFYFDFERYINKITKGRKLIDVYYFIAPLKQQLNPNKYSKQQRMLERFKKLNWHVVICKRKKKDCEEGEKHTIKEDDIRLALSMLRDAYENKYDTALLFSGDGDFAPLPEFVKVKGKKVENYHFAATISNNLLKACSNSVTITKQILNKFFFRG